MNEYQLAFHNYQTDSSMLKSNTNHKYGCTTRNDEILITELVERATPFKPTEQRDLIDDIYGKCKCGTEVRDDNSFCYRCGNKLDWSE